MSKIFRVVLSSPGDVAAERNFVDDAARRLNLLLSGLNYDTHVVVMRWERDAWVGMDPEGTQKLIDKKLGIEESDLLIGIFWRRFGEKSVDDMAPTEHEVRLGYDAFLRNGHPQVLLYFRESGGQPSIDEMQQLFSVLKFKEEFKSRGVYQQYKEVIEFDRSVYDHLLRYSLVDPVRAQAQRTANSNPVRADSEPRLIRAEGVTELLGDFVLKLPQEVLNDTGKEPRRFDMHFFVTPPVMITSPIRIESAAKISTIRLAHIADCRLTTLANAKVSGNDNVLFEDLDLSGLDGAKEQYLRIENIRVNASQLNVAAGANVPVSGLVTIRDRMSGQTLFVEQALLGVASGSSFSFRVEQANKNQSMPWINIPEEAELLVSPKNEIASLPCLFYLRFDELVSGAFKSKDEEGHSNNRTASCGTRFVVRLSGIPYGLRMFVTATSLEPETNSAKHVTESDANGTEGSITSLATVPLIEAAESGVPMEEVPIVGACASAVWEWTLPNDGSSAVRSAQFGVRSLLK